MAGIYVPGVLMGLSHLGPVGHVALHSSSLSQPFARMDPNPKGPPNAIPVPNSDPTNLQILIKCPKLPIKVI